MVYHTDTSYLTNILTVQWCIMAQRAMVCQYTTAQRLKHRNFKKRSMYLFSTRSVFYPLFLLHFCVLQQVLQ